MTSGFWRSAATAVRCADSWKYLWPDGDLLHSVPYSGSVRNLPESCGGLGRNLKFLRFRASEAVTELVGVDDRCQMAREKR